MHSNPNSTPVRDHENLEDHWTISYLVDRLKQHLATIERNDNDNEYGNNLKDLKVFDSKKYYNRAHHFLKIGAFKPVPFFPVNISDLFSTKILVELSELDIPDRKLVLKQAVGRIFEDINFELYHNSISKVLKVKLEK